MLRTSPKSKPKELLPNKLTRRPRLYTSISLYGYLCNYISSIYVYTSLSDIGIATTPVYFSHRKLLMRMNLSHLLIESASIASTTSTYISHKIPDPGEYTHILHLCFPWLFFATLEQIKLLILIERKSHNCHRKTKKNYRFLAIFIYL